MSEVMVDTRQSPACSDRGVVAVAVLDGFYGCGSGAGWSNRALIEILAEVLPVEIDLVVLPVGVDAVSGWQREWCRGVEEALGRSGRRVEVRVLDGNRSGPGRHGEPALTGAVQREVDRLRGESLRSRARLSPLRVGRCAIPPPQAVKPSVRSQPAPNAAGRQAPSR